jgi:predicted DNA-binding transcriptional regulator YafY
MPINKLALIRYKTIDNCLQNHFRKWTLEDLMKAVSDALYEYEGITAGISKRTIQLDIQNMRSEKLGYNAPITVTDKKFYSYSVKNYSITSTPLSKQDLGTLNEVLGVLKQFKGFGYFQELSGMVTKLEDKLHKQKHKGISYIDFEKNELLKGLEFIDPIHKAIINKKSLQLSYQSFKAEKPSEMVFFPYLLKEYRNRWFVLGSSKKARGILNLALDRITRIKELETEEYFENSVVNIATHYDDVIGVTKMPGQKASTIVMHVDKANAPYIKTKPLHRSQTILKEDATGMIFSITVVWNYELEREILGFGEQLKVLSPKRLSGTIQARYKNALKKYQEDLNVED